MARNNKRHRRAH